MEIKVKYILTEEQYARLGKIAEALNKRGMKETPESAFESMMFIGSMHEIEAKMHFHEVMLGISREEQA